MAELLIGCGSRREKRLVYAGRTEWSALTTLDINPDHKPDHVWDLDDLPLPFEDNSFDEIHAYEVLEHVGQQGDWKFFFNQWSDFWRILKPGGIFLGSSPAFYSNWAWGDPGHTRIISQENFIFLCQPNYDQVGISPMTDYRFVYRADFDLLHYVINSAHCGEFVLQAVKPSRVKIP